MEKDENQGFSALLKEADDWFSAMAAVHAKAFHGKVKMGKDRGVVSMYSEVSSSWIRNLGSLIWIFQAILMREAERNGWGSVLNVIDCGCGENELPNRAKNEKGFIDSWRPFVPKITGYDFLGEGERIREAWAKYPLAHDVYVNCNFVRGGFPCEDGSVQGIFSNAFSQYLNPSDSLRVLKFANHKLVDGGVLYFITRREYEDWEKLRKLHNLRINKRPDLGPHGYELRDKKIRGRVKHMSPEAKAVLTPKQRAGFRPYYAHPTDDFVAMLEKSGFQIINDAPTPNGNTERAVHAWLTNGGKPSNGIGAIKVKRVA